jgi:hypothetical protein
MRAPIRILLQTTIPPKPDDWHAGRFSLLRAFLESQRGEDGAPLFAVTARDRTQLADDPVLSTLDRAGFEELWLFAVDEGDGLSAGDREGILRFHAGGGGLLVARDHEDLGCSVCELGSVGAAHFFHTRSPEADESRRVRDDPETTSISWPNYRSGRNGDYQPVEPTEPVHELLRDPRSPSGRVALFPAHPHEGAVGVPKGEHAARVVATGRSVATGRAFNLAVAFERAAHVRGRAVAESSFHHFVDYNWDIAHGCPSFVTETPGDGVGRNPAGLDGVKAYVRNVARWLAPA